MSIRLAEHARTLTGMEAYCVRAFAEALEIIPYTLAENAGLNPIATVTELRNRHAKNETTTGINVRKVGWANTKKKNKLHIVFFRPHKLLSLNFNCALSIRWSVCGLGPPGVTILVVHITAGPNMFCLF